MECKSARINSGSFAANAGLKGALVAVIPGRESAGMLVGAVSNAGRYNYRVGIYELIFTGQALNPILCPVEPEIPKPSGYLAVPASCSNHRLQCFPLANLALIL